MTVTVAAGVPQAAAPTGQEWINVLATPVSNLRFNTIAQASTDYFGGELQSSNSQNDSVTFQRYLQAGTYTFDLFHHTGNSRGIYTIAIDGSNLGTTIDGYSSSSTIIRSTIAGITIVGSTIHSVALTMATANASSSGFFGIISGISLTRTGA